MIIDTGLEDAYLWTDDFVTSIKGDNIGSICKEIYTRVVQPQKTIDGKVIYVQLYNLYVDISGCGRVYKDCLTNMGLLVHDINYKSINTVLPKRCQNIINNNNTKL